MPQFGGGKVLHSFSLEQNKITSIVAQYQHHYYIGLLYNPTYSMFEWVTDEYVSKTFWGPNEPSKTLVLPSPFYSYKVSCF
jgi:hypothetical protein